MKKIVIASDSFKGSLSSSCVAEAAAAGISKVYPECQIIKLATGDGGEGTCKAIASSLPCEWIQIQVCDPIGRRCKAEYAICRTGNDLVAVIEMAQASGLILLDDKERDPMLTSTYGTGEMISDASRRGCRKFIIGLGGSATNDGGTGMLEALGFRFMDKDGNTVVKCCGKKLAEIAEIDTSDVPDEILSSLFTVACDVDTPFYGTEGATRIFAPQKGASAENVEIVELGMRSFAAIIRKQYGIDLCRVKGSGAAGGTGGALYAFMNAQLCKGADLVLDAARFDEIIEDADLVITGEGKIDSQTFYGKLPSVVLRRASAKGIPVIAIGGIVDLESDEILKSGFLSVLPIQPLPIAPEETAAAMQPEATAYNITRTLISVLSQFCISSQN